MAGVGGYGVTQRASFPTGYNNGYAAELQWTDDQQQQQAQQQPTQQAYVPQSHIPGCTSHHSAHCSDGVRDECSLVGRGWLAAFHCRRADLPFARVFLAAAVSPPAGLSRVCACVQTWASSAAANSSTATRTARRRRTACRCRPTSRWSRKDGRASHRLPAACSSCRCFLFFARPTHLIHLRDIAPCFATHMHVDHEQNSAHACIRPWCARTCRRDRDRSRRENSS